jgi:hypothetical protein
METSFESKQAGSPYRRVPYLLFDPEILAIDSGAETLADAAIPYKVVAQSNVHPARLKSQMKLIR